MRLLGVLLGIGIALALTVYVADRVGGDASRTLTSVPTTATATPGATGSPGPPPISAARTAACAADGRIVATAEEAYRAVEGHFADLTTLVAAGYLREAPATLTVTLGPAASTYGLGGC